MPRREQLEALLADDPQDVFLAYAVAMAWASEGHPDQAISRLAEIGQRAPDYVAAWFQQGQLLATGGETGRAREAIEAGIEAARRTDDAHALAEMTEFLEML